MAGPHRRVIPREELTAWERWELGGIDEERRARQPLPQTATPELPVQVQPEPEPVLLPPVDDPVPAYESLPVAEVSLPTAEEIEAIEQQAMREGFDAGLEAGRLAAEDEIGRLKNVLQSLENVTAGAERELAESVLDLALVLARELVRQEVAADRKLLLPAIVEALSGIPPAGGTSRLYLHPDDLSVLEPMLAIELSGETWRLIADPRLSPGDARIETASTQIDLALPGRWHTLLRVLNRAERDDLQWNAPVSPADGAGSGG
ncbi:flagellar assembly protein FliH [Jeongeupia naejangsanensis]|uniref:Flagellar assembly protein FliH n=1 Tax=Jeongeupia naejangsanensis TaxID=613195 RepID=A0ABS2BHZ2_9NEIS|nr:flagellar assembly protein FliH [Jeongeupia naejangsanensis]MBM3115229.1 flagellar assembly protein FliH [Jeongeupia naejangsanensis]